MLRESDTPIVFVGGSLRGINANWLRRIECSPPIREGDLSKLLQHSPRRRVLILDGVFSENQAVTPTECRTLMRSGWSLFGASSMGALRAADLWPEGMVGIGDVFLAYRTGLLKSDADVAVALDPSTYEEITVNIPFLRAALADLLTRGVIDAVKGRKMLNVVAKVHFLERTPEVCRDEWVAANFAEDAWRPALDFITVPANNPKVRDAYLALAHLLSPMWAGVHERDRRLPHMDFREARDDGKPCAETIPGKWRICPACAYRMPSNAIFCPECASTAHENQ